MEKWRNEKLFCLGKKNNENRKCNLYKFTHMPKLHNIYIYIYISKKKKFLLILIKNKSPKHKSRKMKKEEETNVKHKWEEMGVDG